MSIDRFKPIDGRKVWDGFCEIMGSLFMFGVIATLVVAGIIWGLWELVSWLG